MGRTITTTTDLSSYAVGAAVKIAGSECCWVILGESEPDNTVRPVKITSEDCYYYAYGVVGLDMGEPEIVTF